MLLQLFFTFAKIGAFSFGGGYAVIPLLEREIVVNAGWLTNSQMVDIITIAQMTPGPIAINLATFVGFRLGGVVGAAAASLGLVVVPLAVLMLIAQFARLFLREQGRVKAVLAGMRPMVTALIVSAAIYLLYNSVKDPAGGMITLVVLLAAFYTKIHPVLLIVIAGVAGLIIY